MLNPEPIHFLSNRKHSVMSKRAQESTPIEGVAVAKPRPMNLVSRNLLSVKKNSQEDVGDSNSPGNQELDQSLCFIQRQETDAKHQPKPNNVCSRGTTPGNWDGEMNLQAQPAPGNWSEVRTSKSAGPRWNSTMCKSPTINTLRLSSRTCGKA